MRRIYSLFLAFIIIFSMPLTSFAEESPSNTVVVEEESSDNTTAEEASADNIAAASKTAGTVSGNDAAVGSGQTSQSSAVVEQLCIDSKTLYDGMDKTYEQGYIPKVENGKVSIVFPLLGKTYNEKVSITADLGTTQNSPFVFGNYSQTADAKDGAYIFRLEIPLAAGRINGSYPVILNADYLDTSGNLAQQTFSVYVTITDGKNPSTGEEIPEQAPVVNPLYIDSQNLYEGMDKTYSQGYVPHVGDGNAYIIMPLLGQTYDGRVTVTVDLGATTDNPFILGNYSQTISVKDGIYLFDFEIPLASGRKNGAYPVTLTADYLDITGNQARQNFILYVTITDGINADTGPTKEEVETPKLYISACEITPETVGGEEAFSVTVTIENIGAIRARSVILTYGSDTAGIVPAQTNNTMHLENIASGKSETASFAFQTTKDVLAGEQSFFVKLDYVDLYGGIYTENRTFFVRVVQPAKMEYDPISIPKQVTSGDTISVPVSVFNTGKSTLRNVVATISGAGLIPTSSVFFGDILPGESGNGEMEFYVGTLSMTDNTTNDYGKSNGTYTITYMDDNGEEHKEEMEFSTEIIQPLEDSEDVEEEQTAGQWWISVLVAFAIIAIVVSAIIVTKFSRMMRMK